MSLKRSWLRAGSFYTKALRIGGEFVPEAVEIDPLAPGDQPFFIRAPKGKMPQRVAARDLVPGPDSGQRRIQQREFGDAVGILGGEGIADHIADVMGDEVGSLNMQRIEQAGDI